MKNETLFLIRFGWLVWVACTLWMLTLFDGVLDERVAAIAPWLKMSFYIWGAVFASYLGAESGKWARRRYGWARG